MTDLNKDLQKSLEEIDAMADEILAKSENTENQEVQEDIEKGITDENVVDEGAQKEGNVEKAVKPEDVAESYEDDEGKDNNDDEDDDEDDDDKEDVEDKGDDNQEDEKDDKEEITQKSFTDFVAESDELSKGIEVSDFLAEFTRIHGAITDALREDVNKSLQTSTHTANILAKSFNAIMKSQNELAKSIEELRERLETVERQPVGRKAQVSIMEKSFNHSAGLDEGSKELSKAEKLNRLSDMAINGQNGVTINDVIQFESTGALRPELEHLFNQNN